MNLLIVEMKKDEVLFATFQLKRGEPQFLEASRHQIEPDKDVRQLLAERAAGTAGERRILLVLPADSFFTREVDLPVHDRTKLRELLPLELKGETAIDTDELVFDALPLSEGKVLAIWGKKRDLADKIQLLTEAGLEPEVVTASLFHWHTLLPPEPEGTAIAVTDLADLALFRDNNPVCFRHLATEEPAAEVARTLTGVELAKGVKTGKIFLHGNSSSGETTIDHTAAPAFSHMPMSGAISAAFGDDTVTARHLASAYAVAKACASGSPVNLRTGSLAYTADRTRIRKKLRLTMALAVIALLLIFVETGVRYLLVRNDLISLDNSIRAIYREVFPSRKKAVDEVAELRSEIKRLGGSKTSSTVLQILKILSDHKGEEVTGIFETEIDGREVRLKGDARSIQAVNDFKAKVTAYFANAEVSEIKARQDGSITFVFHGSFKGGEK
jgi:general secretion pathway protein L